MIPLRSIATGLPPISGRLLVKVNGIDDVVRCFAGHDKLLNVFVCQQQRRGYRPQVHIEGIQGPLQKEISMKDARKILADQAEYSQCGPSVQGVQGAAPTDEHVARKKNFAGSARNGQMPSFQGFRQTTFATSPVYSMTSPAMNRTPYRYFTTSSPHSSYNYQGVQSQQETGDFVIEPCPQGVQGDDCVRFKMWQENCRRHGLANCEEQLQGIQSGRRTLADILAEQEHLIREIAETYREKIRDANEIYMQGVQGEFSTDFPDVTAPCPQGVQGDDCVRFKLWLENCHKYGFKECEDQLQGIQRGRKTLTQVFAEQHELILRIVEEHKQKASNPQVGRSSKFSNETTSNPPQSQPPDSKLNQRQRLKKAVKEYGSTVVIFHVGISLISLGGFYLAVSSGIDVVGILSKVGVGESLLQSRLATGASTFVVAYAIHKVFAPVRIAITLTSTPFIVRYLRRVGFLKPSTTKKP
ncbi:hypothetical protein ScPMuIL_000338 [Solemya velum]